MGTFLSKMRALGGLTLPTAVPPTPGPGENAIYFKTNGLPYYKDSNGVEYPFIVDEVSVIQNPSFEEWASGKPVGWGSFWRDNGTPPWVWEQSTDRVHGGYSWKINVPANGVGNGSAQSQSFSVEAGQVVTVKVWAKASSAAQQPNITIDFLTSSGAPEYFDSETNSQGQLFPLTTVWTTKTVSFTVPTGHVNGRLSIWPRKTLTTSTASIFVDHIAVDIVTSFSQDTRKVGEVTSFFGAKTSIPEDWLAMDGSTFSSEEYPLLAAHLGATILPDMSNRTVVGASSTKPLGTVGGSASASVASHTHSASGLSTGSARNFGGEARGTASGTNFNTYPKAFDEAHDHNVTGSTGSAGSQTIDIQNPYLALWYIIKAR